MQTPISSATANLLPTMDVRQLIATMREFRDRLLSLVADLDDRQLIGPRLAIVNPPLWEIGHVAWTQEFWVLRHLHGENPIAEHGDRLYNSTDVAHDTRWELLLPSRDLWLVSAWISDVPVVDNSGGQFATVAPEWPRSRIRLVPVLPAEAADGAICGR